MAFCLIWPPISKRAVDRNITQTPTGITRLEQMVGVLEPFEEATTTISAEKKTYPF